MAVLSTYMQLVLGTIPVYALYRLLPRQRPYPGFPVITIARHGWHALLPEKFSWILHGKSMVSKGLDEAKGPFQVLTSSGYRIILPNRFAHELRSHSSLGLKEAFAQDLFPTYPGFDGPRQGLVDETFIQEVVRVKLTQSLGLVTNGLVEEANYSFHDFIGEGLEWQTRYIKQDMLYIVAQLSARVFLGKPLCRNKDWLRVSIDYTTDLFTAAELLRLCPGPVRPLVFWLIPTCIRLVRDVAVARRLILPEIEKRVHKTEEALARGEKADKVADAIGWMVEIAKGRKIDYVGAQLSLTTAAIHTTAETLSKCIVRFVSNPEIIPALRGEIISVLGASGWSTTSFHRMTLLDSFLKEVQRTDSLMTTTMNRVVKTPITLSDGSQLPQGARILVTDDLVNDSTEYEDPHVFDLYRYQKRRQASRAENSNQFVTVTPRNMAFGYGKHVCLGRFFASNELKIALTILLLKYDIRAVLNQELAKNIHFETVTISSPKLQVQVRRREEEIDTGIV